jgi:hypothetical protein
MTMNDDDLYDSYADKFDTMRWTQMYEDLRTYMENNDQALESFKEWWVERQVKYHSQGNDDYLSDQAWNDFNG